MSSMGFALARKVLSHSGDGGSSAYATPPILVAMRIQGVKGRTVDPATSLMP